MSAEFESIYKAITHHPMNAAWQNSGYRPLYTASATAKLVIIGQAPGRKAQESMAPWCDASGDVLRDWLGLSEEQFYDADAVSLLPMDFYYPGKGSHGDLPPRKEFAELWHPKILGLMPNVKLSILVGAYAQGYYLGNSRGNSLTETVHNYKHYLPNFFPIVHPSPLNFRWHSRNPWFVNEIVPALRHQIGAVLPKGLARP